MTVARRVGSLWLLVAGLAAGCGGVRPSEVMPSPRISERLDGAHTFARLGQYAEAREAYATMVSNEGPGADPALLGLARLALDPTNPDRDARLAVGYLDRLLGEYPHSLWGAEARTWRSLLGDVERLQRDVRRQQQDLERLRRALQQEQRETLRLRQERERLRQIDLELERPVRATPNPSSVHAPE